MYPIQRMNLAVITVVLLAGPLLASAETEQSPPAAWSVREIVSPAPANSRQHRMANTVDGKLLLSWVEGAVSITGEQNGADITGQGYVELVGYSASR
jgi:predicted secreted hydrolase